MYADTDALLIEFRDEDVIANADQSRIDAAINFATDMIDEYLREQYALPLVSPSKKLVGIACDIARYRLYEDQPTDLVVLRYDQALSYLRDVARGLVKLDIGDTAPVPLAYTAPEQVFTRLVW
jgi:phage gp36-like protein